MSGRPAEAAPDATRAVGSLDPEAMTAAQRRTARAIASRVQHLWHSPRVARQLLPLRDDEGLLRLLRQFSESVGGALPGMDLCVGEADPCMVVALPPGGHVRSGGPCPPHRDYEPVGPYHKERSVSFYMLLHDTAEHHGGTFVYPGSRDLHCAPRYEETPRSAGRPRKRRRTGETASAGLHPKSLHRDLRALCGDPVRFTGRELTVFRHESAEWHGALPNRSGERRAVLIWSYCTPRLQGKFRRTVEPPAEIARCVNGGDHAGG